jgi:hypothetical protein
MGNIVIGMFVGFPTNVPFIPVLSDWAAVGVAVVALGRGALMIAEEAPAITSNGNTGAAKGAKDRTVGAVAGAAVAAAGALVGTSTGSVAFPDGGAIGETEGAA